MATRSSPRSRRRCAISTRRRWRKRSRCCGRTSSGRSEAVRNRAHAAIVYGAALLFAAALVHRFHALGGPYFTFPETVQDHVAPAPYASRDVILLARRAADIIPRGATVTALQPSLGPNYD